MPKYRQLHTKLIDSFDFAEMPDDFIRVVWLLLILIVDSKGRGIYNAAWIRSKMFPIRQDVTLDNIARTFKWLADRGMIVIYCAQGKEYFHIPTFNDYQSGLEREGKSVLPAPDELTSNSGVTQEEVGHAVSALVSESVSVDECVNGDDAFFKYQRWLETVTGLSQAGEGAVKAIKELMEFDATLEDLQAGYVWLKSTPGRTVKYWGQLVGPSRVAHSKRVNPSSNGHQPEPVLESRTDRNGTTWHY